MRKNLSVSLSASAAMIVAAYSTAAEAYCVGNQCPRERPVEREFVQPRTVEIPRAIPRVVVEPRFVPHAPDIGRPVVIQHEPQNGGEDRRRVHVPTDHTAGSSGGHHHATGAAVADFISNYIANSTPDDLGDEAADTPPNDMVVAISASSDAHAGWAVDQDEEVAKRAATSACQSVSAFPNHCRTVVGPVWAAAVHCNSSDNMQNSGIAASDNWEKALAAAYDAATADPRFSRENCALTILKSTDPTMDPR